MKLIKVLLALIAFGTIWTAYESHIANIGVMAWQHQFEEIRQPDGPMDNEGAAPKVQPSPKSDGGPTYSE